MMITNRARPFADGMAPVSRLGRVALIALPFLAMAGCDQVLDVDDPDVVGLDDIQDASALPAVRASVLGDFSIAYGANPAASSGEGQILISGLLGDEFIHTGTFDTRESIDRRDVSETNPHVEGTFRGLHRARTSAERAADAFAEHDPNTPGHAEVQNLAGYTYVMFGENYCSGIPFSRLTTDGREEYGAPQTTNEVFALAVTIFDAALAAATSAGSAEQEDLARVGQARALLGAGEYQEAAAAAAQVPTDFEYVIFHSESSPRQNNGVWSFSNSDGRWSVADVEGGNGLPFRSDGDVDGTVQDPRIPTLQFGLAQRTQLRERGEHWGQLKFPERGSSTVLASGIEARLIQAEAALRDGAAGLGDFLTLHNELRGTVGLPALDADEVAAMSQTDRENLHFQERAYWLWLTSHRLGDLRRLMWDYGRQADDIFPVGDHHRGGAPYRDATNLPIPLDERNNPEFVECITRNDAGGRT